MPNVASMLMGPGPGRNSLLVRLDPRAKLLFVLVATLSLFIRAEWLDLWGWAAAAVLILGVTRMAPGLLFKHMRGFLWLIALAFGLQLLFLTRPGVPFWQVWDPELLAFKVERAAFFSFRLFLFIVYSTLLMISTSPIELADGLERLFAPLKRFKLPVHEMAMMASIAVRFIPTISEEGRKIYRAQLARGARFQGGLLQRVRALIPLMVPLLLATVRRAEELALAMEARGYDSRARRTSYTRLHWRHQETLLMAGGLALMWLTKQVH